MATVRSVPRSPHVPKLIRFPPEVYTRLEAAARDERRSITSMVVRLVEEALEQRQRDREAPRDGRDAP